MLTFNSVSKGFEKSTGKPVWFSTRSNEPKVPVLSGVDLSLPAGSKVLFVGPNGAGKTTLLKLAGAMLTPDAGRIAWDGKPVRRLAREEIGVMLSIQLLYAGLTAEQNLLFNAALYGCPDADRRIDEACELWGIAPFRDQLVGTFSNGMKAQLGLARATMHRPSLLLLDEPSAFLSPENVDRLVTYLRGTSSTVLITTHHPDPFLQATDQVFRLENGRCVRQ